MVVVVVAITAAMTVVGSSGSEKPAEEFQAETVGIGGSWWKKQEEAESQDWKAEGCEESKMRHSRPCSLEEL
jgi:hypothetical protein